MLHVTEMSKWSVVVKSKTLARSSVPRPPCEPRTWVKSLFVRCTKRYQCIAWAACDTTRRWWGSEGMSELYDQSKATVGFRKSEANRVGVGFDAPASLASIEPNEPKIEAPAEQEVAVTV